MAIAKNKKEKHLQDILIEHVAEEVQLSRSYILLLVFSTIIATLGLLINSTAVVIGAMLISPLAWPLTGLTVGLFTTRRRLAGHSVINTVVSIITVLGIAALIGVLTPTSASELTPEIQELLQPNIFDLLIALAAAVIGVAAIYYPRISATATGVAISTTLLPPLCVSGLAIAFGSWDMFWRSGILFGANVVAIIFAGLITLYVFHFRPSRKAERDRFRIGLAGSFIALIVLAIPLSIYLRDSLTQRDIKQQIQTELKEEIAAVHPQAGVDEVEVEYVPSVDDEVHVNATIYIPEGTFLTVAEQNGIIQHLADSIGQTVDLQLNVVNTLLLRRQDDEKLRQRRIELEEFIRVQVAQINEHADVASVDIVFPQEIAAEESTEGEENITNISLVLRQQHMSTFTYDQKEELRTLVEAELGSPAQLIVEFIQVQRVTKPNEKESLEMTVQNVITQDMAAVSESASVVTVETKAVDKVLQVEAVLRIPNGVEFTTATQSVIEQHLRTETEKEVTLSLQIERFELPTEATETEESEGNVQ